MKILIGTPSGRGLYSNGFVHSLIAMIASLDKAPGVTVHWNTHTQALVSRSRNALVTKAIRGEYDVLWMIDDDMVWGHDAMQAVLDLLSIGAPIVAVAASKRDYPLKFPVRFIEGSEKVLPVLTDKLAEKKTIRVREALTVGTGFMAIRTSALKAMVASGKVASYDDVGDPETYRFFYEATAPNTKGGFYLMGEDETFVIVSREMGYKTVVPMDVTMGHEGTHVFTGKVSDFDPWSAKDKPKNK